MSEVTYEIVLSAKTLSENGNYTKELRLVSWNGGEEKVDIRAWNNEKPLKGISLTYDEAAELYEGLKDVLGKRGLSENDGTR